MSGQQHWAGQRERGSFILMQFTAWLARLLGRRLIGPLIYLTVPYFYLFGAKARRSAHQYQRNLALWSGRAELQPSRRSVFRHLMSFADTPLDQLDVWNGKLGFEHVSLIDSANASANLHRQSRGQTLVAAPLGNLEVHRTLAELGERVTVNALVHTKHTEQFNRLLGEAGSTHLRLIQVSELDAAIMLQLSERLARGEWLAIAGGHVTLKGSRTVNVNVLGKSTFPQEPWRLTGLLQCLVNLIHCLKIDKRYQVTIVPFADRLQWTPSERDEVICHRTQRHAGQLAQRCLDAPLQGFNFYLFWNEDDDTSA
jgi:predicted LPLAT superfamily acyltransferase